ncbi:MAG: hypothetical protein FWH02_07280, partial [Oscillospiraceae bacterium]|nr:hypothetical protein [Oscillospiraceae bacterium]
LIPFFAFETWSSARLSDWADYRTMHMTCAMKGTGLYGLSKWGSGVSPARLLLCANKEEPPRLER